MCRRCPPEPGLIPDKQGDSHACQDGEHRPADDRERPAQHPAGNGDAQAQQQPGPLSFQCFMSYFLSFGWVPLSYRKISIR